MKYTINRPIHIFSRNPDERIQIALNKYQGVILVDLRVWYRTREGHTFRPTKRGICFPVQKMADFEKGIHLLRQSTEAIGCEGRPAPEPSESLDITA